MLSIMPVTDSWDKLERRYGRLINHFWSTAHAGCDTEPEKDWSIFTNTREGDGAITVDQCIAGGLRETEAKLIVDQHNATVVSALSRSRRVACDKSST